VYTTTSIFNKLVYILFVVLLYIINLMIMYINLQHLIRRRVIYKTYFTKKSK